MEPIIMAADEQIVTFNKFSQDNMPKHPKKQSRKRTSKDNANHSTRRTQQNVINSIDPQRTAELRAIAAVEAQLGAPLREDCPILGVEFDGLPVGAFGTYLSSLNIHGAVQAISHNVDRVFHHHETKMHKTAKGQSGTENEYQKVTPSLSLQADDQRVKVNNFVPVQSTGRLKIEEKSNKSTFHAQTNNPFQNIESANFFSHGSETFISSVVGSQRKHGKIGDVGALHINGSDSHLHVKIPPSHQDPLPDFSSDDRFANHKSSSLQLVQGGGSSLASESYNVLSEEHAKLEKKRKNEEARIAKEAEVQEKRIRKEIERQDLARRKRDEQMRKELEKQRREAERALRDKQKEEERILREHRREVERREKIMEKETKRVERQRLKDESRRQREVERMKMATERALAKRLAKETTDLIDDERLELLEAAATTQCLPSIYLLDGETLNELECYRGFLKKFPPSSIKMKLPFTVNPWVNSKDNVGNLFMVWKFLGTFADVLGLWPFTLDEFVQAFHDYDARLLGEVHIALLRTLVKDVEDISKASSSGVASNQYAPGFSGGGHPLLVEAAFAWGFDISEWGLHLNPQTWPEILRQFALSAGYGPKWKKHRREADVLYEDDGKEGDAIVKTLRSGQAVENAVSQMQGRAGRRQRKRHRLTPGTVKFAAFHVLSLEGENGLSILEVADRIQKSGLRDLSTSKTPEASIAAALSRDTKLFERVAPSTYSVRTAYRKDPTDAENILQRARERIQLFENVKIEEEEPEKEVDFVDEAEREEDTDEDVDDVEGDDLEGALVEDDTIACKDGQQRSNSYSENGGCVDINVNLETSAQEENNNIDTRSEIVNYSIPECAEGDKCINKVETLNTLSDEMTIDESHMGESWVQGLTEGDYCDLSVEERLNALVALIEAVNEGHTIRVALEERLEASSSLKRKLWAEAQIDRKRFKEEQTMKTQGQADEGCRIETNDDHPMNEEIKVDIDVSGTDVSTLDKSALVQRISSTQELSSQQQPVHPGEKSRVQLKAEIGQKAEELYAYRFLPLGFDRRYNRYWQFRTSSSKHDRGCGRIYFESALDSEWRVIDSKESFDALVSSLDTRGIREAQLHAMLRKCEHLFIEGTATSTYPVCSEADVDKRSHVEDLNMQICKADVSGFSSGHKKQRHHVDRISQDTLVPHDCAIHVECGQSEIERERALERYLDFDKWLWSKCMDEESILNAVQNGTKRSPTMLRNCEICHELYWPRDRHCPHCHFTFEHACKVEIDVTQHVLECEKRNRGRNCKLEMFPASLPSRIQLLKVEILSIEACIPLEALKPTWTEVQRKNWALKLKSATSSGEICQLMMELEFAIHHEWLSPSYETAEQLLSMMQNRSNTSAMESGAVILPWLPQTSAAVAFRLLSMDAGIYYSQEQKQSKLKTTNVKAEEEIESLKGGSSLMNIVEDSEDEEPSSSEEEKSDDLMDFEPQQSARGRGRSGRGRGRGGKSNMSRSFFTSEMGKRRAKPAAAEANDNDLAEKEMTRSYGRGGYARGRGRGRGHGRGRGRGTNRRGRPSKRGRGRSGRGRPSPAAQEMRLVKISLSGLRQKQVPKQAIEQESLDTDDDSSHRVEWDEQEGYEEENYAISDNYNEDDASNGSGEQGISSGPDQDEPIFDYDIDNNNYGVGDAQQLYMDREYSNHDSGEEDDQFDGDFMGAEEDGEENEGFQSDSSSRESE